MTGPEGVKPPEPIDDISKINESAMRGRERFERTRQNGRKFTLNYYGLADYFLDESVEPDIGENGHDAVTMWLDGVVSPHGATEVNGYGLQSLLGESFAFRVMKDSYTKRSAKRILKELNDLSIKISGQETDSYTGTPDVDRYDKDLVSAIAKDRLREEIESHKERGKRPGFVPKEAELGLEETKALMKYERRIEKIKHDCGPCGEFGEVLEARVIGRIDILADEALLTSGLLDEKKPEDEEIIDRVKERLKSAKRIEARSMMRMTAAEDLLKESIEQGRGGVWLQLIKSTSGAASIFNGNKQWMENQSDLEPIARQWEMIGRMVETHPSNWVETVKRWPSFEEGFRGLAAICTGKYALGSNGEIYPTGAYGMGYIENGKVIDVDDAYVVDASGRRTGLKPGVTRLEEGQIWLDGRAVDVGTRENPNKKSRGKPFDGWNGTVEINGEPVKIFSKNILYWEGINDANVQLFMDGIKKYIAGVEIAQGKEPWDIEVDLGAALARNFFEMSMLASWYGVPRDSKGKPYYGLYTMHEFKFGKGTAPKREINDMWEMSSNPDSEAVKRGITVNGWDEGSLFPYSVNDWGKLTLTRLKQMTEIWKGRKHGLYPLMPYLPESLAKPMFDDRTIRGMVEGGDEFKLETIFGDMKSIERTKTFWLNIAKGISVYEFVSSTFIGDKEPSKATEDMIAFLMQPKNLESLTKSIDLSLIYVDPTEAARLRVNVVATGLAAILREFYMDEFVGLSPHGINTEKVEKHLSDIIKNREWEGTGTGDKIALALRQLIASRFIGTSEDLIKILNKLSAAGLNIENGICFTSQEFKDTFGGGEEYMKRIWNSREDRRNRVVKRQKYKK